MLTPLYFIIAMIGLSLVGLNLWAKQRRARRRERIIHTRFIGYTAPADYMADELAEPYWTRVIEPALTKAYSRIAQGITPANFREELKNRLRLAGSGQSPEMFFFSRVVFSIVALGVSVALVLSIQMPSKLFAILVPVMVAAVVFLFPGIRLNRRAEQRRATIDSGLPEVFDLLSVSVEAGLAFDGALRKLVANSTGPIRDEFGRALGDMQVGISRVEALNALAERTHSDQLKRFAGLVTQADRTGAGIATALRIHARDIKDYRANKAREKAASIPIKILFPMVMFIFPAVFIVILGPAVVTVVKLFTH